MSAPCIVSHLHPTYVTGVPEYDAKAGESLLSRVAVGSLEEAIEIADALAEKADAHWYTHDDFKPSGGAVDLPDGTRIEVRATTWVVLSDEAKMSDYHVTAAAANEGDERAQLAILAAWNAEHGR